MLDLELMPNTIGSSELHKRAREVSPGGVHGYGRWYEPYPLYFKRAAGARLWDIDGNEYIDLHGGLGPCLLGYNHPEVIQAVIDTLTQDGAHFGLPHPREVELSERLVELIPCADMAVLCGGGGSDPCYHSVRLARAYTGRKKILKFEGSYHGWSEPLYLSVSPSAAETGPYDAPKTVATPGTLPEVAANTVALPLNDSDVLEAYLAREGRDIAAIIVEPFVQHMGCVPLEPGYPQLLRQLCDHYGIVLIFDEIQTGFRYDLGGAQKLLGVTPDLAAFGKAMTNGFVLSALVGKRALMSQLQPEGPVHIAGTYNANPVGVSAALKTIEILSRGGGAAHHHLSTLGSTLRDALESTIARLGIKARVQGFCSCWALYFTDQPVRNYRDLLPLRSGKSAKLRHAYRTHLIRHGIFAGPQGSGRCFLSAAHSEDDVAKVVDVTTRFLTEHQTDLR
jgi:glutamate-1-semialdehyde 2,1-aminomutase